MIDLHSHVLHGVDDGAQDLEQALRMCRLAHDDGVTMLVATPHLRHERYWNDDAQRIKNRFDELRRAVEQEFAGAFKVFLGGEIAVSGPALDEIDHFSASGLQSLAGSRYLLLEPNFHAMGPDPVEMIYELVLAGWRPVVAHPERISWLVSDFGLLGAMVSHGALLQVTAMSLTGAFGRDIQEACQAMVEHGWVYYVASDAHDERLRPPLLSEARREVAQIWGEVSAVTFFEDGPRAVIEDRAPVPVPKTTGPSTEPWWRRWLPPA